MAKKIDKFSYNKKSAWNIFNKTQTEQIFIFADEYKSFLNNSKTEKDSNVGGNGGDDNQNGSDSGLNLFITIIAVIIIIGILVLIFIIRR